MKIVIVNSPNSYCGIHQYGLSLYSVLSKNAECKLHLLKPNDDLVSVCKGYDLVVYNWHPITLSSLNQSIINRLNEEGINQKLIVGHDTFADFSNIEFINCDCTAISGIPRPLLDTPNIKEPERLTVGSFGFSFGFKNFETMPSLLYTQCPTAKLRMHLTPYPSGDAYGEAARRIREECDKLGIEHEISEHFISSEELVEFLAGNSINVFLYSELRGRGLSSSIDFAFSANRPVAISNSNMFRHINHEDKFLLDKYTIPEILSFGTDHIQPFREAWSPESLYKKIK